MTDNTESIRRYGEIIARQNKILVSQSDTINRMDKMLTAYRGLAECNNEIIEKHIAERDKAECAAALQDGIMQAQSAEIEYLEGQDKTWSALANDLRAELEDWKAVATGYYLHITAVCGGGIQGPSDFLDSIRAHRGAQRTHEAKIGAFKAKLADDGFGLGADSLRPDPASQSFHRKDNGEDVRIT